MLQSSLSVLAGRDAFPPGFFPLAPLVVFGAALLLFLAGTGAALAFLARHRDLARDLGAAGLAVAVVYATLLLGASLASRERTLPAGEKTDFCGRNCHLACALTGAASPSETARLVTVRTWCDPSTIAATRGCGPLTPPLRARRGGSGVRGVSLRSVDGTLDDLPRHFREALRADPVGAYRDWFRAQEELRERGEAGIARALADDLWELVPQLSFGAAEQRARFLHNAAVFFGSPGPAADLGRARAGFAAALDHFSAHAEDGWHARALHNLGTSLSNLGATAPELAEAVTLFERALEWRTAEREIARGVTLHNLGLALRRLAELDPERRLDHLERSAGCLREAIAIRERNRLAEGRAASERHLGLTLDRLEAARQEKR